MSLPRRYALPVSAVRPDWITAGMVRLGTLSVFVVAIEMIRLRLSQEGAWFVVGSGAALVVVGAAVATIMEGSSEAFWLRRERYGY